MLTFVKVGHGRLALHFVLLLSKLLVRIVSLHVVPSVELEGVVAVLEEARAELEGITPLLVELRVVGPVRRRQRAVLGFSLVVIGNRQGGDGRSQLVVVSVCSSPNLRLFCVVGTTGLLRCFGRCSHGCAGQKCFGKEKENKTLPVTPRWLS